MIPSIYRWSLYHNKYYHIFESLSSGVCPRTRPAAICPAIWTSWGRDEHVVLPCFTRILKHKHQAWWKIQAADYYRTRDDPSNAIWIHGFNRDTWWPRALRIWSMNGRHAICQRSVCCRRNLLWKRRDKYLPAATYPASASVANAWICSPPFQARIFGYLWGCTGLVLYPAISSFRMRACTNACVLFYMVLHCFTLFYIVLHCT